MSPELALQDIPTNTRRESRVALGIVVVTFGLFFAWGLLTQIDAGAVATGEVVPSGRVRSVQHPDGGIISAIHVQDGALVVAGDELLTLDPREARAMADLAEGELRGLQARLADTGREAANWRIRHEALAQLLRNAEEEREINRGMYAQKFISRPRLLQLENQAAQNTAALNENAAELARAEQKIAEIRGQISSTRERRAVALQRLERTHVRAPDSGIVNNLKYATLGGVIPPGGAVLDLVPANEPLLIEARLSPDDIDVVAPGTACRVKLTAYKARSHITLRGTVSDVSATTYPDEGPTRRPYYKVRVRIDEGELGKLERGTMTPGMLAQVDFVAGRRSPLRYLLDPLHDSLGRAFKES